MAIVLIGGVCVLAIGFLIFMSIVGGVLRMFRGGGYNSGGYREPPRQGWGWGRQHQQGWGTHKPMPHHPKPSGGGFKQMFGSGGGSSHHKPSSSSNKSHFGGGGAKKKW